jgi:hypothetical protein
MSQLLGQPVARALFKSGPFANPVVGQELVNGHRIAERDAGIAEAVPFSGEPEPEVAKQKGQRPGRFLPGRNGAA